jgi:methylmalonyl-CoA mutase C-terminal domain/subunit
VGKVGLDGHDRGAKIIARAFRDAGFEVVYTGLHQTPEMVVATAIQEDVDGIALSILSGAHNTLFPRVIELLRKEGFRIPVFGGGIIPDEDIPRLRKAGVQAVFTPGASTGEILDWVRRNIRPRLPGDAEPASPLPPRTRKTASRPVRRGARSAPRRRRRGTVS